MGVSEASFVPHPTPPPLPGGETHGLTALVMQTEYAVSKLCKRN